MSLSIGDSAVREVVLVVARVFQDLPVNLTQQGESPLYRCRFILFPLLLHRTNQGLLVAPFGSNTIGLFLHTIEQTEVEDIGVGRMRRLPLEDDAPAILPASESQSELVVVSSM